MLSFQVESSPITQQSTTASPFAACRGQSIVRGTSWNSGFLAARQATGRQATPSMIMIFVSGVTPNCLLVCSKVCGRGASGRFSSAIDLVDVLDELLTQLLRPYMQSTSRTIERVSRHRVVS